MADIIYNSFKKKLLDGIIDLVNDTIKVALLDDGHSPSDEDEFLSDVNGDEITGTGYTEGGVELANRAVTQDNTGNLGKFDADDASWATATFTARYGVVYKAGAAATSSPLIKLLDFGSNKSPAGVEFKITWSSDGIIRTT